MRRRVTTMLLPGDTWLYPDGTEDVLLEVPAKDGQVVLTLMVHETQGGGEVVTGPVVVKVRVGGGSALRDGRPRCVLAAPEWTE